MQAAMVERNRKESDFEYKIKTKNSAFSEKFYKEMKSDLAGDAGKTIIDVGCGDAKNMLDVRGNYIVGLDYSREALRRAKELAGTQYGNGCDMDLVLADVNHLPLKDNATDVLVSMETIKHLGSDYEKALKEMARVAGDQAFMTFLHKDEAECRGRKPVNNVIVNCDSLEKSLFDEKGLAELLNEDGLTVEKMKVYTYEDLGLDSTVLDPKTKYTIYVKSKKI